MRLPDAAPHLAAREQLLERDRAGPAAAPQLRPHEDRPLADARGRAQTLANETRAWLDHLVTGNPTVHTTPEQARVNLETTIAIVRAAATGKPVRLPLET